MTPPTWSNVTDVIHSGAEDLYAIAQALRQEPRPLGDLLQEMVDAEVLYRWADRRVARYGICREERRAA